jgi:hypothetical protein
MYATRLASKAACRQSEGSFKPPRQLQTCKTAIFRADTPSPVKIVANEAQFSF